MESTPCEDPKRLSHGTLATMADNGRQRRPTEAGPLISQAIPLRHARLKN